MTDLVAAGSLYDLGATLIHLDGQLASRCLPCPAFCFVQPKPSFEFAVLKDHGEFPLSLDRGAYTKSCGGERRGP